MLQWTIDPIQFQLRYTWKLSRNASDSKTNLLVHVQDGSHHGWGEAAPNVRYNETPEKLIEEFNRLNRKDLANLESIDQLSEVLNGTVISYALRFAIESAYVHFYSQIRNTSASGILNLAPPDSIPTSYTIPVMDPAQLLPFFQRENLSRFGIIKLKIDAESGSDCISELLRFRHSGIMVDANEAFTDVEACIHFLERLRKLPILLVEQLMPASAKEESIYLKKYCPFPLFVDESITHEADFSYLEKIADGVNIKLMKAGGYLNGIQLLREAKKCNMKTMIGCMVESTLGIYSGLLLSGLADYADLDSFLIIDDEPFGMVTEQNGILEIKKQYPDPDDLPRR